MEEKQKKKKLTLTVSSKKPSSTSYYPKSKGKTSVVIEKKSTRRWGEKKLQPRENFNKSKTASDAGSKKIPVGKNFDIRKMAEERATRRFKNPNKDITQPKKSTMGRDKALSYASNPELWLTSVLVTIACITLIVLIGYNLSDKNRYFIVENSFLISSDHAICLKIFTFLLALKISSESLDILFFSVSPSI